MNRIIKNWGETIVFHPREVFFPNSIEEIKVLVQKANLENRKIRMVGSHHSFSPLIETSDWLVSLDHLQGIVAFDKEREIVEVLAGTKLFTLSEALHKEGYGLENMGDINVQSVAGAFLTGTHGTGKDFRILVSQVVEFVVVTADGAEKVVSKESDEELFYALGVSLGMLGIVVKMKIKVVKAKVFRYKSEKVSLDYLKRHLSTLSKKNKHFEFYVFPYAKEIQVKTMNQINEPAENLAFQKWKVAFLENRLFYLISECSRVFPKSSKFISKLSAKTVPDTVMRGYSYQLFATERSVKFAEMEYAVPFEKGMEIIEEIRNFIESERIEVHFPIECRFVQNDDYWLSPAYNRKSMYIAVHMYKGMPYEKYFNGIESIMRKYNGKPHWGKMNTLSKDELLKNYDKASDFILLRRKLDPNNIFLNTYLEKLFL